MTPLDQTDLESRILAMLATHPRAQLGIGVRLNVLARNLGIVLADIDEKHALNRALSALKGQGKVQQINQGWVLPSSSRTPESTP